MGIALWIEHLRPGKEAGVRNPPQPSLGQFPSITAVFPAYNDGGTIASMVLAAIAALRQATQDYEVVVVNDGSVDYTGAVLEELARSVPMLRVIHHNGNQGYGAALRAGFSAARKDWIFYTDGDAQYNPLELERLVQAWTEGVDIVNGHKVSRQDPCHRLLLGFLYNRTAQILFGVRIRDVNCDFRLFRRAILDAVSLESISGTIGLEMVKKWQDLGFVFREAPVNHFFRRYGRSQFFQFRRLFLSLRRLAILWWKLVLRREHLQNRKP
jgi:glycosyltransferase involved in cell wall biosynthesis